LAAMKDIQMDSPTVPTMVVLKVVRWVRHMAERWVAWSVQQTADWMVAALVVASVAGMVVE
jgi:hypothetical protein